MHFEDARFEGPASFDSLRCNGDGFFRNAMFKGNKGVTFAHTLVGGRLDFDNAVVEGPVEWPTKSSPYDILLTAVGDVRDLIRRLGDHIVQVEALIVYLLIAVVILSVFEILVERGNSIIPLWVIPSVLLMGLGLVMRVSNPTSSTRDRLTWGSIVGGGCGAICGAVTDILSGGLTAGQGTLIGFGVGGAAGAATGKWIQSWGKKDELIERGDAFEYLFQHRRQDPRIARGDLIDKVLDTQIPSFDINRDGRKWYAYDDLDAFLRSKAEPDE